MNNILSAVHDPELGCISFIVRRLTYRRSGGTQASTSRDYSATGCIHPGTPEMIQLLPEESRHEEFISVYTDFALSLGENSGGITFTAPDRILYGGKEWRLVRLRSWEAFSLYHGLAVLMQEGENFNQ